MTEDRREEILTRLLAVYKSIAGNDNVFRNRDEISEDNRPGIVLLDGDEVKSDTIDASGRGRPSNAPVIIEMSPEAFILVKGKPDEVGSTLNEWRAKMLKAVCEDTSLNELCLEIRYESFTTALATGRSMEGQARLNMTFVYALRISKL